MVAPSTPAPKVAPIKLKLSFGPKSFNPAPTSASAPASSTPIIKLTTSKKGKEKETATERSTQQDEIPDTPSQVEEGGKKKKSKPKVSLNNANPINQSNTQEEPIREENHAGPSRITIPTPVTSTPQPVNTNEASSSSTPLPMTPTPSAKTKAPTKGSTTKKPTKAKSTPRSSKSTTKSKSASKPSAIPLRLLSETAASTPTKPPIPIPITSESSFATPESTAITNTDTNTISEATSPDPLSLPLSPSAYEGEATIVSTPQYHNEFTGYDDTPQSGTGRGRTGGKWMRIKKPLKELLNKALVEMRRKDDYALFDEPVDLEAFPDYLNIIGGEDKMMDMGTMQRKVDTGEYTTVEQLEVDLRLLVEAAQKFNPPGSIPYNSAGRILAVGLKHVERSKPLVLTPSPSPTRESATPFGRGFSVLSGREGTAALEESSKRIEEIPPISYIPEQMLDFPPNSLQALAIGWNLNGGKRIHAKRIVRSREKFNGKWRHWEFDGTRDLAEMDDVVGLLDQWRSTSAEYKNKFVDWRNMRKYAIPNSNGNGIWWESDTSLAGPSTGPGQPPVPFTSYTPRRDRTLERDITPGEFGLSHDIDEEIKYIRKRSGLPFSEPDTNILSEHLRPLRPKPSKSTSSKQQQAQAQHLLNIYENTYPLGRSSNDWVREMVTGDVKGEAYSNSISKFVEGAMKSASSDSSPISEDNTLNGDKIPKLDKPDDVNEEVIPLDEYVSKHYHDGLLSTRSKSRKVVMEISKELSRPIEERPEYLKKLISNAYAKIALNELTSPSNPMDIKPLLRLENDFLHQGVGGRSGMVGVKEGLKWIGNEIERLDRDLREKIKREQQEKKGSSDSSTQGELNGKRKRDEEDEDRITMDSVINKKIKSGSEHEPISTASSPLSTAPNSPQSQSKVIPEPPKSTPITNATSTISKPTTNGNAPLTTSTTKPDVDLGDTPELRSLRLELVAISKFYPLPALKKMRGFEAAKLLPVNVRSLMTVPEDLPKPTHKPNGEVNKNGGSGAGAGVKAKR